MDFNGGSFNTGGFNVGDVEKYISSLTVSVVHAATATVDVTFVRSAGISRSHAVSVFRDLSLVRTGTVSANHTITGTTATNVIVASASVSANHVIAASRDYAGHHTLAVTTVRHPVSLTTSHAVKVSCSVLHTVVAGSLQRGSVSVSVVHAATVALLLKKSVSVAATHAVPSVNGRRVASCAVAADHAIACKAWFREDIAVSLIHTIEVSSYRPTGLPDTGAIHHQPVVSTHFTHGRSGTATATHTPACAVIPVCRAVVVHSMSFTSVTVLKTAAAGAKTYRTQIAAKRKARPALDRPRAYTLSSAVTHVLTPVDQQIDNACHLKIATFCGAELFYIDEDPDEDLQPVVEEQEMYDTTTRIKVSPHAYLTCEIHGYAFSLNQLKNIQMRIGQVGELCIRGHPYGECFITSFRRSRIDNDGLWEYHVEFQQMSPRGIVT